MIFLFADFLLNCYVNVVNFSIQQLLNGRKIKSPQTSKVYWPIRKAKKKMKEKNRFAIVCKVKESSLCTVCWTQLNFICFTVALISIKKSSVLFSSFIFTVHTSQILQTGIFFIPLQLQWKYRERKQNDSQMRKRNKNIHNNKINGNRNG